MEKAVMIIHQMSDDEKIQEIARLREKALHDEASALGNARREGKAEGLIEGEAKGLAKGLAEGKAKGLAEGKAKEQQKMIDAMRLSGLSEDEIQKILSFRK